MDGPITVERLKCCDWSVHEFIEVNFSKLADSNQIFRIGFVSIQYQLGEISLKKVYKVFYGQEPPSGESSTTECRINYPLLAIMY